MSLAPPNQVPLEAAQALARHLREKPEAAQRPAADLAAEFSLPVTFVQELLQSLSTSREPRVGIQPVLSPIVGAFQAARLLFRRLTAEPLPFIGVSAAVAIFGYILLDYYLINGGSEPPLSDSERGVSLVVEGNEAIFVSISLATLALHLACYFRHGMVRYPILGGLICWLISAPTLMTIIWLEASEEQRARAIWALIAVAMGMLVLNVIYASVGVIAAVAGGAWRIRQKDRERQSLSRQELLERMFDVQERLQKMEGANSKTPEKALQRWGDQFRQSPWLYSIAAGVLLSLLEVGLMGAVFGEVSMGPPNPLRVLAGLSIFGLWCLSVAAIGFFSSNLLNAIFSSWVFLLGGLPVTLIPVGEYGVERFMFLVSPALAATQLGAALVIAAIASAGAKVERRAAHDRRLHQNDPAALLAELVRLQWQLSPGTNDVCVLSVDAARSAEMKASADAWSVEYSFREYQLFLERIVHANGGSVISTAGDGVLAEFPSADQAYEAARQIQTDIETFNRKSNRLEKPFRLRAGIHRGQVAGSINDVEFSAVIDIASHVQDAAPIGGIAMTSVVAQQLGNEPLAKLAEPVDGQEVFLSLRPVKDE